MKTLAIIPARYASTRFPGKPLALIHGKTMIERVYRQVEFAVGIDKIIIATDDERIAEHVKDFGGEVMMTETTHQSGTDRCGEVTNRLDSVFDVVVNIQGDEPFIQPEQIELLLTAFTSPETQIATLAKSIDNETDINNPNIVKVVFSEQHLALYFSRSVIPFPRNATAHFFKHIGIYAYRSEILKELLLLQPTTLEKAESLEQLRWIENGYPITLVETVTETISIDTPEDIEQIGL